MDESEIRAQSPDSPGFKAAMRELGITREDLRPRDKVEFMESQQDPMDIVELRWKNHQQEVKKLYGQIAEARKR